MTDLTEQEALNTLLSMMEHAKLNITQIYLLSSLYDGNSINETANRLGITPANARKQIERARKKIANDVTLFQ